MVAIEVKLKPADVTFPIADEVTAQRWYSLLNFSHEFTHEEIATCKRFGMPEEVVSGMIKLRRSLWRSAVEESYRSEIDGIDAVLEDRMETQLPGLIYDFWVKGRLDEADLEGVSERFSVDVMRKIWHYIRRCEGQ
jgi:hypothetical protein